MTIFQIADKFRGDALMYMAWSANETASESEAAAMRRRETRGESWQAMIEASISLAKWGHANNFSTTPIERFADRPTAEGYQGAIDCAADIMRRTIGKQVEDISRVMSKAEIATALICDERSIKTRLGASLRKVKNKRQQWRIDLPAVPDSDDHADLVKYLKANPTKPRRTHTKTPAK